MHEVHVCCQPSLFKRTQGEMCSFVTFSCIAMVTHATAYDVGELDRIRQ